MLNLFIPIFPLEEDVEASMQALKILLFRLLTFSTCSIAFFQFILKNYFTFKNQLYLQKHGSSMDSK